MQMKPQIIHRKDGRLHLNHGPIDLLISLEGCPLEVERAKAQAITAFENTLMGLVTCLQDLRKPFSKLQQEAIKFDNPIAQNMFRAVGKFPCDFITPMAAVAGSVADYILAKLIAGRVLNRAFVNNGGDIALYLNPNLNKVLNYKTAICNFSGQQLAQITIHGHDPINGIATSGWQGRSHSLGIGDNVTVLAKTSAMADAAATLIANAIDLDNCKKINRMPANQLNPDSDLGERLVTVDVEKLENYEIDLALSKGQEFARKLYRMGLIEDAFLNLQGKSLTIKRDGKNLNNYNQNLIKEKQYA